MFLQKKCPAGCTERWQAMCQEEDSDDIPLVVQESVQWDPRIPTDFMKK